MAAQWAAIIEKSNENNAELARQLGRNNDIQSETAKAMGIISQEIRGKSAAPRRKR